LALDEECREITAKIRSTDHRDAIELIAAWAVRPSDLQQLLLQHRPQVVHFSGHGTRGTPGGGISTGTLTSRRDMVLFQALVRLRDDSVSVLIESLPAEALPDPIDAAVPRENRLLLEEKPLLSDCVADSLEHFQELRPLPRKISSADMFVDIAKHGHGESVSRLRHHGIGKQQIEERVQELGLLILQRNCG
jgi:hypothetical protein